MKKFIIGFGVVLAFIVTFGVVVPSIQLGYISFWNPKFQSVERTTFKETKSYIEGMTMDLAKYYGEYQEAKTDETKSVVKNLVRLRFSDFDKNNIDSYELRGFLVECRGF